MSQTAGFADFRKRKDQNYLLILNRVLLVLIALVVVFILLATFVPVLKQRTEQKTALEQSRREVAEQKSLYLKRTKEVARLKNDPDYLGNIARDKLNLMKEGETIFHFDSASTTVAPATH